MILETDDKVFEIIIVSDVQRDGMGAELWDRTNNKMIFEIFRNDSTKKLTFFSDKAEVPLQMLTKFMETFEEKVGRHFHE